MNGAETVSIATGFQPDHRAEVARAFWQAFKGKLSPLLGPDNRAHAFLMRVLDPDFAVSATDASGRFLGVAGFKTGTGALVGGDFGDLVAVYGLFGALWRVPLLAMLERDVKQGVLLMDGIFVTEAARGRGVGTRLLDAITGEARARDLHSVRLDVIDTNARARKLYKRRGFVASDTHSIGPLRHIFGFRHATTMVLVLP